MIQYIKNTYSYYFSKPDFMTILPEDLQRKIIEELVVCGDIAALDSLSKTCKIFNKLVQEQQPSFKRIRDSYRTIKKSTQEGCTSITVLRPINNRLNHEYYLFPNTMFVGHVVCIILDKRLSQMSKKVSENQLLGRAKDFIKCSRTEIRTLPHLLPIMDIRDRRTLDVFEEDRKKEYNSKLLILKNDYEIDLSYQDVYFADRSTPEQRLAAIEATDPMQFI